MQRSIVGSALRLLDRAWMPRTTVQTPFHWDNNTWRDTFCRVDASNREALARAGEERRRRQADIKTLSCSGGCSPVDEEERRQVDIKAGR